LENSNQKIEVLCFDLLKEFDDFVTKKEFIKANQLLVSIYFYESKELRKDEKRGVYVAYDIEYTKVGYKKKVDTVESRFL
jgi:CRISPR-associated endonuclease/helicase Cas3